MKLILQVVFAHGYLWRDRFPDVVLWPRVNLMLDPRWALFLVLAISAIRQDGVLAITSGVIATICGVGFIAAGIYNRSRSPLAASVQTATGLPLLPATVVYTIASAEKGIELLTVGGVIFFADLSANWLAVVEANYLLFRDGTEVPRPTWFGRVWDAWWTLPRQILRPSHTQESPT